MSLHPSGVIFGCTPKTYTECMRLHLFGLPSAYRDLVCRIQSATPLFLFNYETRQMSCGFTAACEGGWELETGAFGGKYKAQVRFVSDEWEAVLDEEQYKDVVEYMSDGRRMKFELSEVQVKQMLRLAHAKKNRRKGIKYDDMLGVTKTEKFKIHGRALKSKKEKAAGHGNRLLGRHGWPGVKKLSKFDWDDFVQGSEWGDGEKAFEKLLVSVQQELEEQLQSMEEDLVNDIADKYNPDHCREGGNFEIYSKWYSRLMEALKCRQTAPCANDMILG